MILKNKIEINQKSLQNFYNKLQTEEYNWQQYEIPYFSIYMHKKMNYFSYNLQKYFNYSSGQLLGKKSKKIKFFKKSKKSFSFTLNTLNRKLNKKLSSILFFFCKNFNLKNYLWIKKFFFIIKPDIYFFMFTHSWNYITKGKRRIKKKIFRNLFKNSKII